MFAFKFVIVLNVLGQINLQYNTREKEKKIRFERKYI